MPPSNWSRRSSGIEGALRRAIIGDLSTHYANPYTEFLTLPSRLANVIELGRNDDLARRQLEASPIVLREYLSEMLDAGYLKHVTGVLQVLKDYLVSDPNGRKAHKVMANDPAAILESFQDDERLDERWRANSLASMRRTIATKRTAWARLAERLLSAIGSKRI